MNNCERAKEISLNIAYNFRSIKNHNPGMPESFYMKEALRMRFRSWPDMEIESFISDCEDIDDLIEKIKWHIKKKLSPFEGQGII